MSFLFLKNNPFTSLMNTLWSSRSLHIAPTGRYQLDPSKFPFYCLYYTKEVKWAPFVLFEIQIRIKRHQFDSTSTHNHMYFTKGNKNLKQFLECLLAFQRFNMNIHPPIRKTLFNIFSCIYETDNLVFGTNCYDPTNLIV